MYDILRTTVIGFVLIFSDVIWFFLKGEPFVREVKKERQKAKRIKKKKRNAKIFRIVLKKLTKKRTRPSFI